MKTQTFHRFLLVISALAFMAAACSLPTLTQNRPDTTDPEAQVKTAAVRTIDAMMTEVTTGQVSTSTPGGPATATSQAPTLAPTGTQQPVATNVVIPTSTATSICDLAGFISDVTIPDGWTTTPGASFVKTWRLKNNGTCTWTPGYAVIFDSGSSYTGPASFNLDKTVPPGQTVDISISLTAPGSPGSYKWNFKMRNAAGLIFGLGQNSATFFIDFKVINITPVSGAYDFTANYCQAEWTGNGVALPCVGTDGDSDGFVLLKTRPILETGYVDDEPALLTNPPRVNDGVIRGKYPLRTVKSGDRFVAIIGCEHNASKCNVRFQLDYQIDNGPIQTLAGWNEVYDNNFTLVDYDLSSLSGNNVRLILTVLANGASDGDRALWLLPRIVNDTP